MTAASFADLQPLLNQFAGEGLMLSCYAPLRGASEGFRLEWEGPFRAGADSLWKAVGEDGRARLELQENLDAIRRALASAVAGDARWLAVFSATRRNFFQAVPLEVPVEFDLVMDRSPYLVPLLSSILRRREYLAVHTNTHRGRVYAAGPGAVRLLWELDADEPENQPPSGGRAGYEQAGVRIGRQREDRIHHYRKALVRELERVWDAGRYEGLILLGEHPVLENTRGVFPSRLADRVRREVPESWYEEPSQVEAKVQTTAAELFARDEAEVVPGFWDLLREGKAVTGHRKVLEALQSGQVGPNGFGYLVFGPDPRESVGRCTVCRMLSIGAMGPCPKCQAPCAPGNLWEELLLTALQHKIAAYYVPDPRKLALYDGLAVVLPKAKRVAPGQSPIAATAAR